jgi:multidrug resistance protein
MTQIFQGLAPTFIGGFSDSAGRRPAYMIGFIIYLGANIGLALQTNYAALMVLRCIQSIGSSGMVAMGSGVAADCVTSAERGAYIGFMSVGTVLGPSLSPILGGLLSQYLGWKAIFWFLAIFGGVIFILFLLFFPETCWKVVGDGSVPPAGYHQSLISYLNQRKRTEAGPPPNHEARDALAQARHVHFPNPLSTLRIIADKETALILFYASLVYAGYYAIATTITTQFAAIYGYGDLVLGLCFVPIGAGGILATVTNGQWDPVDGNYRRHARRLGMPLTKNKQHDLTHFPLERARLQVLLPLLYFSCLVTPIYGWVLNAHVSVAGPLVLLFFLGFGLSGLFKVVQILIIDITPGKPATVTAAFNLVRCLLGAAMTAVVNPIIDAWGNGWTFTFIALVWLVFSPMLLVLLRVGPRWRQERREKEARRQEKREAQRAANNDKA